MTTVKFLMLWHFCGVGTEKFIKLISFHSPIWSIYFKTFTSPYATRFIETFIVVLLWFLLSIRNFQSDLCLLLVKCVLGLIKGDLTWFLSGPIYRRLSSWCLLTHTDPLRRTRLSLLFARVIGLHTWHQ